MGIKRNGAAVATANGGALSGATELRAALDSVQANVFVADRDLTLVYMNRKAEATVATLDASIRSAFSVGSRDLLGGSIHRFHRDPARVERILHDPANFPHEATFTFGDTALSTHINGIFDAGGHLYGYIVAWEDVTESRHIAETAQRLATDVAAASTQLTATSSELSVNADDASGQAATVASATEEMSASLQEVASSAAQAASVAAEAVGAVGQANESVGKLSDSSTKVGEIVRMITTIAEQTNLLALNATIEAARAGDAGKGFAVVAHEVKELSRETAEATERISQMVEALQTDSRAATEALGAVAARIDTINDQQASIAGAVEQQTAVTGEIASSIAGVAATADATTAAVATLQQASGELAAKAEELQALVARS